MKRSATKTEILSELKRAKKRIAELEKRTSVDLEELASGQILKLFVEYAPAAIAMFDRKMRYIAASRRFIIDYDLVGQDIIGRSHYEIFPEIPERWKEIHKRCLAGGVEMVEEDPFPRADGSMDWVRWEIHPWRDSNQAVGGIILFSEVITGRKQSEAALRQSEEQHRLISMMNSDYVYSSAVQEDGKCITHWVSGAIESITGYELDEINQLPMGFLSLIEGADLGALANQTAGLSETDMLTAEYRIRRKDGELRWLRDSMRRTSKDSSLTVALIGTVQDITSQKIVEGKLRDSEMKYRTLAENSLQGMAIYQEQKIIYANPSMCKIYGYSLEEFTSMTPAQIKSLFHPEDLASARSSLQKDSVLDSKTSFSDARFIRKDGTIGWVRTSNIRIEYDGQPAVLSTNLDISAARDADGRLRSQENRFRALIEHGLDNISLLSGDGTLLWENPAVNHTLGYKHDEFIGTNIFELIHPQDREWVMSKFNSLKANPGGYEKDTFRLLHRNGFWLQIEAIATNLLQEPDVNAIVINYRDITERHKAEQMLQRSERFLQSVQDSLSAHIAILNEEGIIVNVNSAWRKFAEHNNYRNLTYGVGLNYLTICDSVIGPDAEDASTVAGLIRDVLTGKVEETQWEYACHSPEEKRWFIVRITKFNDGGQQWIVLAHENISARKSVEESLRIVAEENQVIVNAVPDLLFRIDQQGTIVGYHARNTNDLYVSPQAFLGRSLREIMPAHIAEMGLDAISRTNTLREMVEINYQLSVNGEERIYENRFVPLSNNEVLSIVRDITESRQAEEALRTSEERYRDLVNLLPVIVYTDHKVNQAYHRDFVSPEIKNMLGFTPEEWIDGNIELWLKQIHADDRERVKNEYERCVQYMLPFEEEYRIFSKIGEMFWVHDQFNIKVSNDGEMSIHGIVSDITERKNARDSLERRVAEMEALYENGLLINRLLNPELIGQKVVEILSEKLRWHHAAVRIYHEDTNQLELVALHHPGLEMPQLNEQSTRLDSMIFNPDSGITGWVVQHRRPVLSSDLKKDPRYIETYHGMRSGLYVPILLGDRPLGAISVESDLQGAFDENDQRLLMTLANQAAVAVENAKLYTLIREELKEREQAEERLRQSEARQNGIIEAAMDAIITVDESQNVVLFNGAAERIFGCPVSEALGQPLNRFIPERYHVAHKKHVEEFGKTGVTTRNMNALGEVLGRRTDGSEFPLEASISQITVAGTKLYTIILRDITQRKQAEIELRNSEEKYRLLAQELEQRVQERTAEVQDLYNNSPAGYHSLDSDGNLLMVNQTELSWLGYSREELIGRPFVDLLTEDGRRLFGISFPNFKKQGFVRDLEFDLICKDGSILSTLVNATAMYDDNGNYIMSRSTVFDNTDHKMAESALRESEERYRKAIAAADAVPYDLSYAEDRFTFIDEGIERITGYSPAELTPQKWTEIIQDAHMLGKFEGYSLEEAKKKVRDGDAQGAWKCDFRIITKDGRDCWISDTSVQVQNVDGQVIGSIGIFEDITARKNAEETLRRANVELEKVMQMKDEFLASMSHELRTPLTGVLGLSEALQMDTYGPLNEKQRKILSMVEQSGRHLLELINDILDLSKIEAGRLELNVDQCLLEDVCHAALQLVKGMTQQKKQHISFTIKPSSINLQVDSRRIKQILVNLLSNASKFTSQEGSIGLDVHGDSELGRVVLTVWDTGIGIKVDEMSKLFKPFVQLDGGLARENEGTGLGLSLSHRLAEMHRGTIHAESVFGQGSRFILTLPWEQAPADKLDRHEHLHDLEIAPPAISDPDQPLLMIVDDNEMILANLEDVLKSNHYQVVTAQNGKECLQKVGIFHPQLILMDVQMPGMDGLAVMRELRDHSDKVVSLTPIIAVTALAMPGDRERCLAAGANEYLPKPFPLPDLLRIINSLLKNE